MEATLDLAGERSLVHLHVHHLRLRALLWNMPPVGRLLGTGQGRIESKPREVWERPGSLAGLPGRCWQMKLVLEGGRGGLDPQAAPVRRITCQAEAPKTGA
jgi:hypothetical protein